MSTGDPTGYPFPPQNPPPQPAAIPTEPVAPEHPLPGEDENEDE